MKKKDITYLVISLAILAIIVLFFYSKYSNKNSVATGGVTQVEVIDPIASSYDQSALTMLADPTKAKDFTPVISLDGLGNPAPFGPLH